MSEVGDETVAKTKTKADDSVVIPAIDTAVTEAMSDLSVELIKTPRSKIDIDGLEDCTPDGHRDQRTNSEEHKVQSTLNGNQPLVGGDFIMDGRGNLATLSFCFQGRENTPFAGKRYGLTVLHLCGTLGDPIYSFATNIRDINADNKYLSKKVGSVVASHTGIDAMLFEIEPDVQVDLNTIKLSHDTTCILDLSAIVNHLALCTRLHGFGAQRRGTVGKYVDIWKSPDHHQLPVLDHDIGVVSSSFNSDGNEVQKLKAITDAGDYGMIYTDENGNPVAMHHAITANRDLTKYTSWGVPLWRIVKSFWEYFGVDAPSAFSDYMPLPRGVARVEQSFFPGEEPKDWEEEYMVVDQPKIIVSMRIVE